MTGLNSSVHASCVSKDKQGVLLIGPSGSGKSDLALRLMDCGFSLVADDRVVLNGRRAHAPTELQGLLEIRGFGILHLPFEKHTELALCVRLQTGVRLPEPRRCAWTGVPMIDIDAASISAAQRIMLALRCVRGEVELRCGCFQT